MRLPWLAVLTAVGMGTLFWKWRLGQRRVSSAPTWGCGYKTNDPRLQYTASSFVKTYSNLIEPVLSLHKNDVTINEIFPGDTEYSTHNYDKLEFYLIDKNLKWLKKFLLKQVFLK